MTTQPPAGPTNPQYPGQQYPPAPTAYPPPSPTSGGYFPPTAPPAFAPGGATPAAPKKNPFWVRPVAILAGIALVAGLVWFFNRDNVENAEVGDCVHVTSDTEFNIVDCTSADAGFKVLSVQDSSTCTSDDVDASIARKGGDAKSWCLRLVIKEGECIPTDGSAKVDCSAPSAAYKVTKVVSGTQDPASCAEGEIGRPYEAENFILCYTDV